MTDRPHPIHLVDEPHDDEQPTLPNDATLERIVLAGCLTWRTDIDDVTAAITPADLHQPRHELILHAITHLYARGDPVDIGSVTTRLRELGSLNRVGGQPYLHELATHAITPGNAGYHAHTLAALATRRRLIAAGKAIEALAYKTADDEHTLHQAALTYLEEIPRGVPGVDEDGMPGLTIDELLNTNDPEYDWLIPGFLERRDRLILTGGEGAGKSTLLRQIGIQAASGIHPWTLDTVDPIRVLVIDLENSESQNRRAFRSLRFVAADNLTNGQMVVHSKLDGLDLTTAHDEAWLDKMLTYHRPDLLITGPIYKLAAGNPNDEKDAKPAAMALDRIRDRHNVALILEAHSRKGETTNPRHRPKEPFGWSGWMRWPEFGFHIDIDGDLTSWRGKRDRDREFPTHLKQGGSWPWNPIVTLADQEWLEIRRTAEAAGQRLSVRELARRLDVNETTLRRRIAGREMELEGIYASAEVV